MGLLDKFKGELVDIIEWMEDDRSKLAWRFPRFQNEIKNGAKLVVREGQQAIFVHHGQMADTFGPGLYELTTSNMPIMTTLQGWPYGFNSPFKCEVYFINTRPITDLRWGTPNPVTIRDNDFGLVPVRANGLCVVRVADAAIFMRNMIGTDSQVTVEEITELIRQIVNQSFADFVLSTGAGAIDLQAKQVELSEKLRAFVAEKVDDEFGLGVDSVTMNVSMPEEITQAIAAGVAEGQREGLRARNVGDIDRYRDVKMVDAMVEAAQNPGGLAGAGVGLGVGVQLGQQMGQVFGGATAPGAPAAPAAAPAAMYYVGVPGGQQQGPFPVQQLAADAAAGRFSPQMLVWTQGMENWAPAAQVPALAQLFSTPPPMAPPMPPAMPPAP